MKLNTHLKIQLAFLIVIISALVYLLISINNIKRIDENIKSLEEREIKLIEALKQFEVDKSLEEQKLLDKIEELEKLELQEIDHMLKQ